MRHPARRPARPAGDAGSRGCSAPPPAAPSTSWNEPAIELGRDHNRLSGIIVDSAYRVHHELGPGLLESVYEHCLALELQARALTLARQVPQPITYRGIHMESGFRLDLVVEDLVVVEIKSVERILPVHEAQLLTYLKLSGRQLGLLINFNVARVKDGIRRIVRSG